MNSGVITVANENVSIVTVCRMVGLDLPEDVESSRSAKVHCPFEEVYHSDRGVEPAMRIYPESNSAYCFSCSAYFTPVGLAAQAMDINRRDAAERLLDRIGYRRPDLASAWQQASEFTPELDHALLAQALKTYCARVVGGWSARQFEPNVAGRLSRCLNLLDLVVTDDDANLWLTTCKTVMAQFE